MGRPFQHRGRQRPVCANCLLEIPGKPYTQNGLNFCCEGCAQGGPCCCTYGGCPEPDLTAAEATSAYIE